MIAHGRVYRDIERIKGRVKEAISLSFGIEKSGGRERLPHVVRGNITGQDRELEILEVRGNVVDRRLAKDIGLVAVVISPLARRPRDVGRVGGLGAAAQRLSACGLSACHVERVKMPVREMKSTEGLAARGRCHRIGGLGLGEGYGVGSYSYRK